MINFKRHYAKEATFSVNYMGTSFNKVNFVID